MADVVAAKLGIILPSSYSFHLLPNLRVAKGPERSGVTQPEDLGFWVGSGRQSACAMGK